MLSYKVHLNSIWFSLAGVGLVQRFVSLKRCVVIKNGKKVLKVEKENCAPKLIMRIEMMFGIDVQMSSSYLVFSVASPSDRN